MDEMTLLRQLEADTPAPTEAVLESAFASLSARMTAADDRGQRHLPSRRRRRMTRRRWVGIGALGAVAAITAFVLTDTIGIAGLRPGASAAAAELLDHTAETTIATTDPVVKAGQFREVTFRSVHILDTDDGKGHDAIITIHEDRTTWIPADVTGTWTQVRFPERSAGQSWGVYGNEVSDAENAEFKNQPPQVLHGKAGAFLGETAITPDSVNALPKDPRILLNHIYRLTLGTGPSPDGEALVFIGDTLNTGFADAALRAALYRAAALIPGVTLTPDAATLDGHTGVAIGRTEVRTGLRQELIIDPATGDLIGEREITTRPSTPFAAGETISWSSANSAVVDAIPTKYRS